MQYQYEEDDDDNSDPYYEEQGEEYEPGEGLQDPDELNSDGQPLLSDQQIRNIINAIPSFRYEQKENKSTDSTASTKKKGKEEVEKMCSVCLEQLKTGVQCKMLECLHIFHAGCINNWLK